MTVKVEFSINTVELEVKYLYNLVMKCQIVMFLGLFLTSYLRTSMY